MINSTDQLNDVISTTVYSLKSDWKENTLPYYKVLHGNMVRNITFEIVLRERRNSFYAQVTPN